MFRSWERSVSAILRFAAGTLALCLCQAALASSITGFSPSFGQPGNVVKISGSGLSGATLVNLNPNNPTPADFNVLSDSQLEVVVPIGATTGTLEVFIGNTGITSSQSFQVAPLVTNFTPQSGTSPTIVAIFGENFSAAGTTVVFSGTNASVAATYIASTQVAATVPPGAATGPITVITSAGTNVSTNIFTSGTLPTISGFSPPVGPYGASVSISGGNFFSPITVKFHGSNATAAVTSTTQLTATVPTGATTGPITVTTPFGSVTSGNSFTTSAGPIITNFSPTVGDVTTAVTITGYNLGSVTSVTFSGKPGTITGYTADGIQTFPPSGSGIGPIKVFTSTSSFTTSNNFTNATGPIISDFSPTLGPAGSPVTIDGINFTSATTVKIGGATATHSLVGESQISATVPAGALTGPISVTGNSTTYTTISNFTVTSTKPVITGTDPPHGVRGATVTINGANFANLANPAVQFNGVAATYQPPTSTTSLIATVPAGATTGFVTVNNNSGAGTATALFYGQPWVTNVSATSGIVNSTLVLTGRSLTNATSVSVNGVNYSFTNSPTVIAAIVPTNATTGLIEVVTPGGVFIPTNIFAILPKIYSFTPAFGPAGTIVTINGTSLFNVSSVKFGGTSATPVSVSTNQVQVAVPGNAASGPLTVITPYGSDVSSNIFIATKPSLELLTKSVSPIVANAGESVTYTLTVTNEGPSLTTSMVVTDSIPEGLTVVASNASVGTITESGGNLLWRFPFLDTNATATMHVIATATFPSVITNIAYLAFAEGNLNVDNNFAYARAYFLSAQQQTLSVTADTNSDLLSLSWPVSPIAFGLQTSTNLSATNAWQAATSIVLITNGLNTYTDTISGPAKFYRLIFQ